MNKNTIAESSSHQAVGLGDILLAGIPRTIFKRNKAHEDVITSLTWNSHDDCYVYLSSSNDGTCKVWDVHRRNPVWCINLDSKVTFAKWSLSGCDIITGVSNEIRIYDVITERLIRSHTTCDTLTCAAIHPCLEDILLCGTKNGIEAFDRRMNERRSFRKYLFPVCEEINDIIFINEQEFLSTVSSGSGESFVVLRTFQNAPEALYTILTESLKCTCIKLHPSHKWFGVQCGGDNGCIATFWATDPYASRRKYCGHKVAFPISTDIDYSPNGKHIVSGDENGYIVYFDCTIINPIPVYVSSHHRTSPFNRVHWHKSQPNTLLSSTLSGEIFVWK